MDRLLDDAFYLKTDDHRFYKLKITRSTLELHDLQLHFLYSYYWDQIRSVLFTRRNRVRLRIKTILILELWFSFVSKIESNRCQTCMEGSCILQRTPAVGVWNFVRHRGRIKFKPSSATAERMQEELLQTLEANSMAAIEKYKANKGEEEDNEEAEEEEANNMATITIFTMKDSTPEVSIEVNRSVSVIQPNFSPRHSTPKKDSPFEVYKDDLI